MPHYSGSSWHYSTKECQINQENGVSNLLNLYSRCSQNELAVGIAWYPDARVRAEEIAAMYHLSLETVIKVAAALSPKCKWENNMDSAEWVIRQWLGGCFIPDYSLYTSGQAYLQKCPRPEPGKLVLAEDPRVDAPPSGGLKSSVIKALWILEGHDCLSGPKVWDFYHCILDWESYLGACIDSHAIQAWFGSFDGGTYGVPPAFYTLVRADYIKAAKMVGLSPLQFQAVLWVGKKRISSEQGRRSPIKWVVSQEIENA